MAAPAASLLLRYAGRSLQRPIPRALEELRLSPRVLKDCPRRLYSSDGVGSKSQQDKTLQLERAHPDLAEKALEERMIWHTGNLNRGLDKLEGRIDRLIAILKEREAQYKRYDEWTLRVVLGFTGIYGVAFLVMKSWSA